MADLSDPQINEGWSPPSILTSWLSTLKSFWSGSHRLARVQSVVLVGSNLTLFSIAYLEVRNDKSETTWLLLDYESDRSDKLKLTQTGTGGLSELREALDDSKASYGYARVSYSNDKESTREKFILVVCV